MHIESALVSTGVATALAVASSSGVVKSKIDIGKMIKKPDPVLTGVAGASVFALQMINFTIANTGSSGHIGGGFLLSSIIGPAPAFIVMSVILLVQSLFFGDGGLLALGVNIFNLGIVPCFLIYPIFKKMIKKEGVSKLVSNFLGGFLSMAIGAVFVIAEVGISNTPGIDISNFAYNMFIIHLLIGAVEGVITAALVYGYDMASSKSEKLAIRLAGGLSVLTAGLFSLFASSYPDGLEWSVSKVVGEASYGFSSPVYEVFDRIQGATSLFPDYSVKFLESSLTTSVAGVIGVLIVFAILFAVNRKNRLLINR